MSEGGLFVSAVSVSLNLTPPLVHGIMVIKRIIKK